MNKTEKFWDKIANKYEKVEKRPDPGLIRIIDKTKKYLNAKDIVLEFGCGPGTLAIEIAGNVKKIHAIDISSKMIEIAKRKAIEYKIENIDFKQASIYDEKYKKRSFDVILAFNILHLMEDNRQVIQRITELLKPGGLFISSTPCLAENMALLAKLLFYPIIILSKTGLVSQNLKRFKFSELENIITSKDLQIIGTEKIYHMINGYFIVAKKRT